MSIEGRIAVDINFTDSATVGGASSVKKIQLVDATQYSSGKVAIITGTCSTAGVTLTPASLDYVGADGSAVAFSSVSRVAFVGDKHIKMYQGVFNLGQAEPNQVAVVGNPYAGDSLATVSFASSFASNGTAVYTAVFYGT